MSTLAERIKKIDFLVYILFVIVFFILVFLSSQPQQNTYQVSLEEAEMYCYNMGFNYNQIEESGLVQCGRIYDTNDKRIVWIKPISKGVGEVVVQQLQLIPFTVGD